MFFGNIVLDNENCSKVDIKNLIVNNNCSEIEQIIKNNIQNSKKLLNDIENISEIEQYQKDFGYSYFSDIIDKDKKYDISFVGVDYYKRNDFVRTHCSDIVLKGIPKKVFFIDFLDRIEQLIREIIEFLENNITYIKHLKELQNIKEFLSNFNESVYYNEQYHFNDFDKKYVNLKLLENYSNNPKNIYKVLKNSYLKIFKILKNIIENNYFQ